MCDIATTSPHVGIIWAFHGVHDFRMQRQIRCCMQLWTWQRQDVTGLLWFQGITKLQHPCWEIPAPCPTILFSRMTYPHQIRKTSMCLFNKYNNMCYRYWQILLYMLYCSCQEELLHEKLFIKGDPKDTESWWVVWSELRGQSSPIQTPNQERARNNKTSWQRHSPKNAW